MSLFLLGSFGWPESSSSLSILMSSSDSSLSLVCWAQWRIPFFLAGWLTSSLACILKGSIRPGSLCPGAFIGWLKSEGCYGTEIRWSEWPLLELMASSRLPKATRWHSWIQVSLNRKWNHIVVFNISQFIIHDCFCSPRYFPSGYLDYKKIAIMKSLRAATLYTKIVTII